MEWNLGTVWNFYGIQLDVDITGFGRYHIVFVGLLKMAKKEKKRNSDLQAISLLLNMVSLPNKPTNPARKKQKIPRQCVFSLSVSLSLSSNSLICHSHSRCSCSHYTIKFICFSFSLCCSLARSLARCETFIYNILLYNKTWTNMSSTWFWYDVFIFLSSHKWVAAHHLEWVHRKWTM